MKCNDVQQRIKAYLDNELTGRDAEVISSHIKSCSSCLQKAALLSRTWDILLELPGPETVPDLVPATLSRIPEEAAAFFFAKPNLAGLLVRTLRRTNVTDLTTERWDSQNESDLPVASGLYIYHIDIPGVGEKIGKMVVFMPEERLDQF